MRILAAISFGLLLLATSLGCVARAQEPQAQPQPENARKILSKVLPVYPELAHKMNLEGVVKLRVTVAANGNVKLVETLGGSPVLAKAAEIAIYKWRWVQGKEESKELVEIKFQP
jgi:TonB family protein